MTLALIIYLVFTALPAISTLAIVFCSSWAALAFFGLTFGYIAKDSYPSEPALWDWTTKTLLKRYAKVAVACLVVSVLIPTKEVTAYMLAGYGVQTVAQNDQVQELAGDGLDVLQQLMKKAKNSLEEEIEEKK